MSFRLYDLEDVNKIIMKILTTFILFFACTTLGISQEISNAGVYYINGFENVSIEPILYTKTKGKASGLFNGKVKREYNGAVSKTLVSNNPEFIFSYKEIPSGMKRQFYMFFISDNPSDIVLAKLQQRDKRRDLVISKVNSLSGSVITANGISTSTIITPIDNGLFKVTFSEPLEEGEYCFMLYDPNGAFADGYIFDFSVGGRNLIQEHRNKAGKDSMYFY